MSHDWYVPRLCISTRSAFINEEVELQVGSGDILIYCCCCIWVWVTRRTDCPTCSNTCLYPLSHHITDDHNLLISARLIY